MTYIKLLFTGFLIFKISLSIAVPTLTSGEATGPIGSISKTITNKESHTNLGMLTLLLVQVIRSFIKR